MAWWPRPNKRPLAASGLRTAIIVGLTALMSACVFWEWLLPVPIASAPYLVVPLLLWAAYSSGFKGGSAAVFVVSAAAVTGTVNGLGAFASEGDTHAALLLLQVFIAVVSTSTLMLAAAVEERRSWANTLTEANEKLEEKVAARTGELTRSNAKLLAYRDHLEDLVAHRTRQLEDSNRELEAFSYTVSHDLRAPLRSINGFSGALIDEFSAKLGDGGVDYLQRVQAAAERMGQQIDDILEISRVTRQPVKRELLDLCLMAEDVIATLREQEPQRQVEFHCNGPIKVAADPSLMRLVLDNLIGNAWKYSRDRTPAEIHFECRVEDGETCYRVRDNGTGFDMQYAEQLFTPFQRLHGADFDGHGIGLSTVARIINRHGGRIWGEGAVDQGATFSFTISED